jgi:RNA recognition motif-containing protein
MTTRVFVGNLAFSANDLTLQEAFAEAGEVSGASVVTRGRRSLGYGFVDMASAEGAQAAVDKLDGKDLFGRTVKVEIAKERPAPVEGEAKKPRNPKKRKAKKAPKKADGEATEGASAEGAEGAKKNAPKKKKKKTRAPRKPQGPKVDSETVLFVAGLPFDYSDDDLKSLFEAYSPASAHVVRTLTGRSRGYGFVEVADKATQLKVIDEMNGKELNENRKLAVSISNSPKTSQGAEKPTEGEAEAAASE